MPSGRRDCRIEASLSAVSRKTDEQSWNSILWFCSANDMTLSFTACVTSVYLRTAAQMNKEHQTMKAKPRKQREREREREREERETDRQRGRKTEREKDRERETERWEETWRPRETDTESERVAKPHINLTA